VSREISEANSTTASTPAEKYPYFIRRNNVGDERDNRLEMHVRDKVASQEAEFRSMLADHLETNEITKTDARSSPFSQHFNIPSASLN
jgi:hypothetical protein